MKPTKAQPLRAIDVVRREPSPTLKSNCRTLAESGKPLVRPDVGRNGKPDANSIANVGAYQVQRIDSDIMVGTLLTLNAKGITALPVHDSLVVRHDRANEARTVMERVFERRTGVPAVVPIKSS